MITYMIIVLAFAAFTGFIMEAYKKMLRKDRAQVWEIRMVALALSSLFGFVCWKITDVAELSGYLVSTLWLIVPFTVIIYLLQLPACMAFWKPLLKKWIEKRAD